MLPRVVGLVDDAATAVLAEYVRAAVEPVSVTLKADASPVTAADLAAQAILVPGLRGLDSQLPILSEEDVIPPYDVRARWGRLWLVDPLDGTKEFLERNGEFTINVALVEDGVPVLGVVSAPALGTVYWGARGAGAFVRAAGAAPRPIAVRGYAPAQPLAVVVSRSHADARTAAFLAALPALRQSTLGSSLKLALVAEGKADLYPRFGPTMEWDVAAGDALVRAAGGRVTDLTGAHLRYNKPDLHNPAFIASGDPALPWQGYL